MGTTWEDYYVFLSTSRDSDALTRSNFIKGLEAIGGEDPEQVVTAGVSHWACGWVDTIYIHKDAHDALRKADEVMAALAIYPVLDEEHHWELEHEEAEGVWKDCYSPKERLEFYRNNQCDWYSFKDLLRSVRTGDAFYGYASDLLA
tara:strand:+ start:2235 stop:2672 length:438 start_codon:yes stop_codon:yes gene_type:complete